jgi:hypothetical protein
MACCNATQKGMLWLSNLPVMKMHEDLLETSTDVVFQVPIYYVLKLFEQKYDSN